MLLAGLGAGLLTGCQHGFLHLRCCDRLRKPAEGQTHPKVAAADVEQAGPLGYAQDGPSRSPYLEVDTPHGRAGVAVQPSRLQQNYELEVQLPDPQPVVRAQPVLPPQPREENPPPHTIPAAAPGPEEPLVLAMNCIFKKDLSKAVAALQCYDQATQELFMRWLSPLPMLTKGVNQLQPKDVAELQDQLNSLIQELRPRTDLIIDKMCYCEFGSIAGYGVYKPLPDEYQFRASPSPIHRTGDSVHIYAELRNCSSKKKGDYYETYLSSKLDIHDANNRLVWTRSFKDQIGPLRSLALRNDFFTSYNFYVPAKILPGRYTLTIRVVDETTQPHRVATHSLPFLIKEAN
jgi:hypothetical protein